MGMFEPGNLEKAIEAHNLDLRGRAGLDLNHIEREMVRSLTDIVRRATYVLDLLSTPEHAIDAIHEIASGAGAGGTVSTEWCKTVALASKAVMITTYATERKAEVEA